MSLSSITVRPGGKSLAAYHQERAALYGAVVALLEDDADPLEIADVQRRLARVRGSQHRARALIEQVLEDDRLTEQREQWLRSNGARPAADLEALSALAHQAAQCARALWDGDMAAAADLWDAQSHTVCGLVGRDLQSYADELGALEVPVYARVGRALRYLLEDDAALAGLRTRGPPR